MQGTTKGVPIDTDPLLANNSDLLVPSQKAVKTYTDNGLSNKVSKAGDTMSGSLILSGDPTVAYQAATKSYVDTLINGIDWKQSVNAATVTTLPAYTVTGSGQILTGTTNGAIPSATTDTINLTVNQRVLVKNETSTLTPNNGIYIVTQVGSGSLPFILTRASDANTPALLAEATVSVGAGSTLANTQWHCNPAAVPAIIGTTYITFAQIGTGTYTFSSPLVNNSGVISIPLSTASVNGYLSSTDWTNFNTAYTNRITSLTTTGSSGSATLTSNTLNIPAYTLAGLGGQASSTNLTSLAGLTYTSSAYVKMTAAGTFTLDTNTYYLTSNPSGFTSNTGTVTSVGLSSATSGVTIGSTPVTTSGTITIAIATATSLQNGLLSSTDWSTFNGKANALSGTINTIAYWDSATTISSLALATYPSLTELSYVKGVTSSIQTALDNKVDENTAITGATKTKITYDTKGLVTAGADATTADIADSTNKRYVTDAQLVIIGNTSGTNTGDNSANSLYSGLATSKQDTLVSGTNIKTINTVSLLGSSDISLPTTSSTDTFTNKRITSRVSSTTSSATPSVNTDSFDAVTITALAVAITGVTVTGTPTDFQKLIFRIKDNGTARAITWGASFEAKGVALPTTTVISKVLTVGFIYDSVSTKWGCVASAQQA